MNDCPTKNELHRLLDDALPHEHRDAIAHHVSACSRCQATLDGMTADTPVDRLRVRRDHAVEESEPALASLLDRLHHTPMTDLDLHLSGGTAEIELRFPGLPTATAPLGVLGHYEILEQLGSGAAGILFKARDTKLGRLVAIKILRPELASFRSARLRFEREARAAAAIRNPHVVTVYDVGNPPDFPPYLVMELIAGESLQGWLRREGTLPPRDAAIVANDVALGLAAAHAQGLVHRDVKPSNIMLEGPSGPAKVTDFGLADCWEGGANVTHEGQLLGTPAYMSPEQAAGQNDAVGPASDIYGVGVVLYQCTTGRVPFNGQGRQLLYRVIHDEPRPPSRLGVALSRDLEAIILQCLAKEPQRRYAAAQDLADDLGRWLRGEPVLAHKTGRLERAWRFIRRRPAAAVLVPLLLLFAIGGVAYGVMHWTAAGNYKEMRDVAAHRRQAGDRHLENGDSAAARLEYMEAVLVCEALVPDFPNDVDVLGDLAAGYERLASLEEELGQFGLAQQWAKKALALFPRIEAEQLGRMPMYLDWRRSLEEKLDLYDQAPRAVNDLSFALSKPAKQAASLLLMRVNALCQQHRHAEIPETAEKLRELSPKDADNLYNVACCYGLAVAAAERDDQRMEHQSKAIATLRQAIAAGFNDVDHISTDPDLRAIRDSDDFQKLIESMRK